MLEWIISSAVLTVIIIVLRFILKGKISPRLQYALWALVLVRLLVPVSFGSSAASVMNAVPPDIAETVLSVGAPSGAYTGTAPMQPVPAADPLPSDEQIQVSVNNDSVTDFTVKVTDWGAIAKTVWLSGALLVAFWFIASNLRFWQRLRRTRREYSGEYISHLRVYITDAVDTPCLFGLFRPAIYLTPESAADETTLRHGIEHETTHYHHGDHVWSLLRGACLVLHWYNPLVWLAAVLSRNDAELACDEATIKRIGENERAEYGRTLIDMTCQKRPALLLTATTMTGSQSSIKERIMLIAKKPKTAIYTLVAVVLIAAVAVGCTFTGASRSLTGEPVFTRLDEVSSITLAALPNDMRMVDEEHFEEILEWVSSFTLGEKQQGDAAPGSNSYSIILAYSGDESESSGLDIVVRDGTAYYVERPEFPKGWYEIWGDADDNSVAVDAGVDAPTAVIDYARDYVAQEISFYHEAWPEIEDASDPCRVREAKITGLTQINTGTAGLDYGINLYRLEYRLLVEGNFEGILVGGMAMDNGWLTEWSSMGQPYLLLHYDSNGDETAWQQICVTNTLTMQEQYNTPEMLDQYGDMYTAAAMELYSSYLVNNTDTSKINRQIIDVLNSDGAYATAALDALTDSLMNYPAETFTVIGARSEGIQDWICWSLANYMDGMALDTGDALTMDGLSESADFARELLWKYMSGSYEAPKSWRQIYLDFWDETVPSLTEDDEIFAVGLFDTESDGVAELAIWYPESTDGVLFFTDGIMTYHNLGNIYEGAPPLDLNCVLCVQSGDTIDRESVNTLLNAWRPTA